MSTEDFSIRDPQRFELNYPLVVLAALGPWTQTEVAMAPVIVRRDRHGNTV